MKKIAALLCLLLIPIAVLGNRSVKAESLEAVASGFLPLLVEPGVTVYARVEPENAPAEFVQVIDLDAGASLFFWHGTVVRPGTGEGAFGGANPFFNRHYMSTIWENVDGAVCISNGQFFLNTSQGLTVDPTALAFSLKRNGRVVSEGYSRYAYRPYRQLLEIGADGARIRPFRVRALYGAHAGDAIVGLDEHAPVRASQALGRTFLGVGGASRYGWHQQVLIYNGVAASQAQAAATLRAFGADDVIMLDGGNSTQLRCGGQDYLFRARSLPQAIVTMPARPHPPLPPSLAE